MSEWLGGYEPHDPEVARRQDDWLRNWGRRDSCRVLDLGCGQGRTMLPLAELGHDVLGVDVDPDCLDVCRQIAMEQGTPIRVREHDFLRDRLDDESPFDLVCCLGNTFMLIETDAEAVQLLGRCAQLLRPDGLIVLDDLPGLFMPEVESGNWQTGISEDASLQFIWSDTPDVFTVRSAEDVDPDQWSLRPGDIPLRLWRSESLEAVAIEAGLSVPEPDPDGAMLVMRSVRAPGGS